MRATDALTCDNASATTAAKELFGGRYVFSVVGTMGGGTVKLQVLARDGSTFVDCADITGSQTGVTVTGTQKVYDLAWGQYRINIATATAVFASVARAAQSD